MTETTQTQMTQPGGRRPRSPEFQLAMDVSRGLRQDLFHDAFAFRPLPRMRTDGPVTRSLPPALRDKVTLFPHALVVLAGLLTLLISLAANGGGDLAQFLTGLMGMGAVLLTLLRPVVAFWSSLVVALVAAQYGNWWDSDWPWAPGAFVTQLVVLTVVAMRTRPRTAAWMWTLTAAYGLVMEGFFPDGHTLTNTMPFLFVSALALLVVTVWHVRREAVQKVTAQQTVTAHERSKRTLLEERTTIARELHDVVAHHMS
ncbi:histidine kinase, partial [Streptomyces anthocyanicus]